MRQEQSCIHHSAPPSCHAQWSRNLRSLPVLHVSPAGALSSPGGTSASSSPAAWVDAHLPELGGVRSEQPLGGSGWSSTFLLDTASGRRLFVKTSPQRDGAMFRGEALGLKAMEGTVDRMCC